MVNVESKFIYIKRHIDTALSCCHTSNWQFIGVNAHVSERVRRFAYVLVHSTINMSTYTVKKNHAQTQKLDEWMNENDRKLRTSFMLRSKKFEQFEVQSL